MSPRIGARCMRMGPTASSYGPGSPRRWGAGSASGSARRWAALTTDRTATQREAGPETKLFRGDPALRRSERCPDAFVEMLEGRLVAAEGDRVLRARIEALLHPLAGREILLLDRRHQQVEVVDGDGRGAGFPDLRGDAEGLLRSEEHTSE